MYLSCNSFAVACDKPSYDQYHEGEELTAYAADQSADVIFVLEQKPCNNEALNKLGDLASNIDTALKTKGWYWCISSMHANEICSLMFSFYFLPKVWPTTSLV